MAYASNTSAVEQNPEVRVCRCHADNKYDPRPGNLLLQVKCTMVC